MEDIVEEYDATMNKTLEKINQYYPSSVVATFAEGVQKANPNCDVKYKNGRIEVASNFVTNDVTISVVRSTAEPETQTTHTFSAELPDGRVVEMPPPGDDWVEIEREEFKRGDKRMMWADIKGKWFATKKLDEFVVIAELNQCWLYEYGPRLQKNQMPILSITTWQRTVKPQAPEETEYQFDTEFGRPSCPSNTNYIGLEIWPERGSEVE
jgi:hypothetical protein